MRSLPLQTAGAWLIGEEPAGGGIPGRPALISRWARLRAPDLLQLTAPSRPRPDRQRQSAHTHLTASAPGKCLHAQYMQEYAFRAAGCKYIQCMDSYNIHIIGNIRKYSKPHLKPCKRFRSIWQRIVLQASCTALLKGKLRNSDSAMSRHFATDAPPVGFGGCHLILAEAPWGLHSL